MKLHTLLATAAIGLVISTGAFAATAPAASGTPAPASSYTSMPSATASNSPASSATAQPSQTASNGQTQNQTVLQLADSNSQFTTLAKAIRAAGLEQTLSAQGPLTVFAPTNAAFAKLGTSKLNDLLTNPASKQELTQILTYHVVPQNVTAQTQTATAAEPASLTTSEGQSLNVSRQGNTLQVQNARSVGATMNGSNGSIIAIDSVLMPEAQAKMGMAPAPQNAMQSSTSSNSRTPTSPAAPAGAMAPAAR